MDRKIVTHTDFIEIGKKNDYFLWHFMQKKQEESQLSLWSIFKERHGGLNGMSEILNSFNVPYYESYVEDSIDFLHELGIPYHMLWKPPVHPLTMIDRNYFFKPVVIGFKKFNKVYSTFDECYCVEGVIEVINKINPELILNYQG